MSTFSKLRPFPPVELLSRRKLTTKIPKAETSELVQLSPSLQSLMMMLISLLMMLIRLMINPLEEMLLTNLLKKRKRQQQTNWPRRKPTKKKIQP